MHISCFFVVVRLFVTRRGGILRSPEQLAYLLFRIPVPFANMARLWRCFLDLLSFAPFMGVA